VNRRARKRGPEPAPLSVEPLSASADLPMKRAVPTPASPLESPVPPRRGFRRFGFMRSWEGQPIDASAGIPFCTGLAPTSLGSVNDLAM
jgi:hypothetical protein